MRTRTYLCCFIATYLALCPTHAQAPADAPRIPPTTELGGPAIWAPYDKIEAVLTALAQ